MNSQPDNSEKNMVMNSRTNTPMKSVFKYWLIIGLILMVHSSAVAQFTGGDGRSDTSLRYEFSTVPTYIAEIQGPTQGWRILGSPVDGATYRELLDGVWSQGFLNAAFLDGEPSVYVYDEVTRTFNPPNDAFNTIGTTVTNAVNAQGRAALIYIYADDNADGVPNEWPKQLSLRGDLNAGDFTLSLTNTIPDPDDFAGGWHMISNPYNFPISWIDMVEQEAISGISPAMYIFDTNSLGETDGYRVNLGTPPGELPENQSHNGIIMPFQGFWVQVTSTDEPGVIEFSESFQTEQTGSLFGQPTNQDITPHITMNLSGPAGEMATVLRFSGESSFVIERPFSMTGNQLEFGFLGNRLRSLLMVNQPRQFNETIQLPVLFDAAVSGTYAISFYDAAVFSESWVERVQLLDILENELYDVNEGTVITFQHSADQKNVDSGEGKNAPTSIPFEIASKSNMDIEARFKLIITPGTMVSTPVESEIPSVVSLSQNYPNPFNPVTQIRYELPESVEVRLDVFNIQGQRVATLVNGVQQAGVHTLSFDASALASGVYLYRLRAGQSVITKKMTLLK